MTTSSQIRQLFFNFFKERNHQILPSAPIVIKNDPTLMFTNAGMNQFKDIFLDLKELPWNRVANTQKCLRVSGKHNDLEEVGLDGYHHTMFEMLGNWSFGDYFKREAIYWAYEFLTKVCNISTDIIYVTYFEGDNIENIEIDEEARNIWLELLPSTKVLAGSKKDNFWEMGDSGPCGPCSEIHVDLRSVDEKKIIPGHQLVNKRHPEVIELWNLVFIEYNRDINGVLHKLRKKHVDTGMGFERLCRVIQKVPTNYHTDLFIPILNRIEELTSFRYGFDSKIDVAFRVIADHIRAVAFAIADGQLPSNVKAGYVIRRIIRRAIRYGYSFLNMDVPFIYALVHVLVEIMKDTFPEMAKQSSFIQKIVEEEEKSFLRTLQTGITLFENYLRKNPGVKILDGAFAFELYDTYGFPLDLTTLLCNEKGISVDTQQFEQMLQRQRQRSREDAQVDINDWIVLIPIEKTEFVGWDYTKTKIRIARYRRIVKKGKEIFHLVFDKTPFYAESGGQVGDKGTIEYNGVIVNILDTFKEFELIIHVVDRLPECLDCEWNAKVDEQIRLDTARNHTATHLLHYVLRNILGKHIEQKGSLVHSDYLRFDFSHYSKLTDEELMQIEFLVNKLIMDNITIKDIRSVSYEEALQQGAIALFGEKYDDIVRVVRFGDSIELCGGTHVSATGQIGLFLITSESSVASGVRRIEALTGEKALNFVQNKIKTLSQIAHEYNNPRDILETILKFKEKHKKLEKSYDTLLNEYAHFLAETNKDSIKKIKDTNVSTLKFRMSEELFESFCNQVKKVFPAPFYVVLLNSNHNIFHLSIIISSDLVKKHQYHAGKLIQEIATKFRGKGGGHIDIANAVFVNLNNEDIDAIFKFAIEVFFDKLT